MFHRHKWGPHIVLEYYWDTSWNLNLFSTRSMRVCEKCEKTKTDNGYGVARPPAPEQPGEERFQKQYDAYFDGRLGFNGRG